ncbi:hypothetical protein [Paenibacillus konkukensis]|uniref:hypothetical protein n=1 Tax=Paenibacillus konkukensis TaxID=2020716 RepID=UPI00201DAD72|nr:hypothetical protein [Paenibacillus konkukensis]
MLIDAVDVSSRGLLPVRPGDAYPGYQAPGAALRKQHLQAPLSPPAKFYTRSLSDPDSPR